MAFIANIADLREAARRRLPSVIFDYIEGGGYERETLHRNLADLRSVALLPRVLQDVSARSASKTLVGERCSIPLALAPVGACGLAWPNGEVEAALAARDAGTPFCLSTLSISTIEDVATATRAPFWFQLYLMRDRAVGEELVQRAGAAGCSALVLSLDLHVRSQRHGEQKHGLGAPPRVGIGTLWDGLSHPAWLLSMAGSRRRTFGNLVGLVPNARSVPRVTEWLEGQFDPTLGPKDVEWARRVWSGKLIVKGVLHPDEVQACVDLGADAVVLSNHGGRQVDGAVSSTSMIPAVVDRVGGRIQVLADGGVRSGVDVLKMLALGADGCLIGRAYMYGLAAHGRRGVAKALDLIRAELDQNMALCGLSQLDRLPADLVHNNPFRVTEVAPGAARAQLL